MTKALAALGLAAIMTLVALPALGQGTKPAAAPAKDGTLYDVQFAFNNTTYAGTMTLKIAKGMVSGSMSIDTPAKVTGVVSGTLKSTKLALDYPFDMAGEQPCSGRVVIDATMDAKATAAQGTARATGCGDPAEGTFSIKRAVKK
jgi:hypothetical protein